MIKTFDQLTKEQQAEAVKNNPSDYSEYKYIIYPAEVKKESDPFAIID